MVKPELGNREKGELHMLNKQKNNACCVKFLKSGAKNACVWYAKTAEGDRVSLCTHGRHIV